MGDAGFQSRDPRIQIRYQNNLDPEHCSFEHNLQVHLNSQERRTAVVYICRVEDPHSFQCGSGSIILG
jgi:hypothetical protein